MKQIWQYSILLISSVLCITPVAAQDDTGWQGLPKLELSGFADVFYVYDFNQPQGLNRQNFIFNHNRHNEYNLNLGLLQFSVDHKKYRSTLALQTGTYANDNYAAEPGLLKNIFEATIGVSLNQENNLWLDAGIMPSHLGFESAISMDNMTLTRSLSAENSPYFLTGAKLTYSPNQRWEIAALMVNGWQRIQRLEGNSLPSFGTQVNYHPSEKVTLNWSTFIGTDDPDTSRRMRYFNNFYGLFKITDKLDLIAGFDIGIQQESKDSNAYDVWYSPTIIGQYQINERWKSSLRAEYYQDETGIIIPTTTANGFKTAGISWNLDYTPTQNLVCRIEGRWLNSQDQVFLTANASSQNNFIIATSIAIKFSEVLRK